MLAINLIKDSFYSEKDIAGNLSVINETRRKYGSIINDACSTANARLEEYLLSGLFFIESRGDINAINGNAIGIAQIDTATASNIPFWLSKRAKIMTANQKAKIYELFGKTKADCMLNLVWDNSPSKCSGGKDSTNLVTRQDLLNPEKAIWLASMYLDFLIDKYSYGPLPFSAPTAIKMERVIVHYNAGQGTVKKVPTSLNTSDTLSYVRRNISPITSDYITKFIGKNGMIDILTR